MFFFYLRKSFLEPLPHILPLNSIFPWAISVKIGILSKVWNNWSTWNYLIKSYSWTLKTLNMTRFYDFIIFTCYYTYCYWPFKGSNKTNSIQNFNPNIIIQIDEYMYTHVRVTHECKTLYRAQLSIKKSIQ